MMAAKKKNPAAVALGRLGGKARAKALSAEERSLGAARAARALWKIRKELASRPA